MVEYNMRVSSDDILHGMQDCYYGFCQDIEEGNLRLGKCALFLYREWLKRNPGEAILQMDCLELDIKRREEEMATKK